MSGQIWIEDLEIDDANESEMARHGVSPAEVLEVFELGYRLFRNKKDSAQTHIMVGRTRGGRELWIPIRPLDSPGVWRPATAFQP